MSVRAHLGSAARHAAVQRAQWARDRRARPRRSTPTCARSDVRLTQGGEPTFVSVDDREGGEWNTEAMGPTKRVLSADLMERLRAQYGARRPAALRPGQVVSGRAAAALVAQPVLAQGRRADLARPDAVRRASTTTTARPPAKAREFLRRLALRLGVDPRNVFAGFEDAWYYLWRERKLPSNVDPLDSRLADPLERERLRQVFERGLDAAGRPRAADRARRARRPALALERPGTCATSAATWSRAIRRSAFACRSIRCRGRAPATCRGSIRPTPTSSCRRSPATSGDGRGRRAGVARRRTSRPRRRRARTRRRAARTTSTATRRRQRGRRRAALERSANRPASSSAPRSAPSRATAGSTSSCRRPSALEDYLELVAAVEDTARGDAACRSSSKATSRRKDPRLRAAARHARPGRDRGQRPSGVELERAGRADDAPLRGGARDAPDDREVHARRPPHRHRRRQPLRARRRDAGRLAVPAPARPARQHDRLLAQPSGAELPVLGHVHRPDQPGAAHRRGAQRLGLRDRDRLRRAARASPRSRPARRRRGWSTGCCATC